MRELLQSILLDKLEEQAEQQLQEVIQHFQNLPTTVLLQTPAQGGWSIAACLDHLNTYSTFYLPRLSAAFEKATEVSGDTTFRYSMLGRYFIRLIDPNTSTKKMKAMGKHQPSEDLDPHVVVAVWIQHMENLLAVLKRARLYELRRMRITTSISPLIRLNGGDVLHFVLVHTSRHLAQTKSLLEENR